MGWGGERISVGQQPEEKKKVVFKLSSLVFKNFYISSFNHFLIDR